MGSLARRALSVLTASTPPRGRALNGFVEALLQKFEDCRPGLGDVQVRAGGEAVERYFLDLYQAETPRLEQAIRLQEPFLGREDGIQFQREVDELVRRVVVPAYVRLATRFTRRERNDFYRLPEAAHWLERIGWCGIGIGLGVLAIRAPFVPLWAKEWVVPFALGGLLWPNLRAVLAFRRYEHELGQLIERADREIERVDIAYLTRRRAAGEPVAGAVAGDVAGRDGSGSGEAEGLGEGAPASPRRGQEEVR